MQGGQGLRFRRTIGGLLACVLSMAMPMAPATADATGPESISVTVDAPGYVWPSRPTITYTVHMTTGAEPAEFTLVPKSPTRWSGDPAVTDGLGTPIDLGTPKMLGPGEARGFGLPLAPIPPRPSCVRGVLGLGALAGINVDLPEHVATAFEISATLSAAPWPDIDYSTRFHLGLGSTIYPPELGPGMPEVGASASGLQGVRMDLREGDGRSSGFKRMSPRISGQLDPPIRGQKVRVRAVPFGTRSRFFVDATAFRMRGSHALGSARTDRKGRFHLQRRKLKSGTYVAMAQMVGSPSGFVADWSCGRPFSMTRRTTEPSAAASR